MPFILKMILALVSGSILGSILGPQAEVLGTFGKAMIQVIKALAAPLLFLVIIEAFLKAESFLGKGRKLFKVLGINTAFAVIIGFSLSAIFKPGSLLLAHADKLGTSAETAKKMFDVDGIHWVDAIMGWVPKNILQPFIEQSLISLVLLALAIGLALRSVKLMTSQNDSLLESFNHLEAIIDLLIKVIQKLFGWLVHIVPFVVFTVVAQTIGKFGFSAFHALFAYLGVGLLGLAIQTTLVYSGWIKWGSNLSLKNFWRATKEPCAHAFGLNSSLAALPFTLKALDSLKISRSSSRMGACVATNFNNDGILLYEAMAVLFIAQAHGIDLNLLQQFEAVAACIIAGIGIAGVPEAGLISLAVVLHTVGLPAEFLPFLLSVDWLLGRCRSVTNVAADMTVSATLDAKSKHPFKTA